MLVSEICENYPHIAGAIATLGRGDFERIQSEEVIVDREQLSMIDRFLAGHIDDLESWFLFDRWMSDTESVAFLSGRFLAMTVNG